MMMRLPARAPVTVDGMITVLAGSIGWQYLGYVCNLLILKYRRVAQLVRAPA